MMVGFATAQGLWDQSRWPNFAVAEMACRCGCGEVWWSPRDFDAIQKIRVLLGRPVALNSTHRCRRHNAKVGGAPNSEHKKIAFDFSLVRPKATERELGTLWQAAKQAGLTTVGLYATFIHFDRRPGRFWVSGGDRWLGFFKGN